MVSAQTTYYIGPWDPIEYPPVTGTPGWEIQDDNVTGLSPSDPFASWSQFVNEINTNPTPNTTVNLFSDAYVESYDYDNDGANENGILGHNLGVSLVLDNAANGLTINGSSTGCQTLFDNSANGTGNLFASLTGMDGVTVRDMYLLNGYAGAFSIVNSTNVLIENCVFDNNDLNAVPVFRIESDNGTPMNITFRNCVFINNNNNTAKFDIQRQATGSLITIDFEDCVWSCNSSNSGGTAMRVRNSAGSGAAVLDFTGCTFANNVTSGSQGGAVWLDGAETITTFTNTNFISNVCTGSNGAGAIFIGNDETVDFIGCTFYDNQATGSSADGGAIGAVSGSVASGATVDITNCTFDNNSAADDGAAIQLRYTQITMDNVHLVNNTGGDGVVTLANTGVNLTISNYTCAGNSAPDGCVYNRGPGTLIDNGGAATGSPVDLSAAAPDFACGAYCAIEIPGTCLATTLGSAVCAAPGSTGSICGSVFTDDLDGIKEIGTDDAAIDNAYILLYDINGDLIGTTNSDASGAYCFNNIPNGTYYVGFAAPTATPNVTLQDNTGDGTTDSDIDQTTQTSHLIEIDITGGIVNDDSPTPAASVNNVDAGFTAAVNISGTLFEDTDLDNLFGINETNIIAGAITVNLIDESTGMVIATVQTTPGGVNTGATYTFTNVPPGTYSVEIDITDPDIPANLTLGTPQTVTTIVVGLTESVGGIDFGFDPLVCNADSDGDGVCDTVDIDDDNDGILDVVELGCAEGTVFGTTCFGSDPAEDDDMDGTPNYQDPDWADCGGALVNGVCPSTDGDEDGIPNYLDLDADNDGIQDIIEGGGFDGDNDGQVDYPTPGDPTSMTDADNDGLSDDPIIDTDDDGIPDLVADPDTGDPGTQSNLDPVNTDGGQGPDYLDLDADDDGIPDIVEAGGTDSNNDGYIDDYDPTTNSYGANDPDSDGWGNSIDGDTDNDGTPESTTSVLIDDCNTCANDDVDNDNAPNHLDLDSDGDTCFDTVEADVVDNDANGDGIVAGITPIVDTDGDGWSDVTDSDNGGTVLTNTNPASDDYTNAAVQAAGCSSSCNVETGTWND